MKKRQILLVGQPQLNEERAAALAKKIGEVVNGRKPVLISATDEASIHTAAMLSHPLGSEPTSCNLWDHRSASEESDAYRQRLAERLRLPVSSLEVVCASPDVIETVLELINHGEVNHNVVLAVIAVDCSVNGDWIRVVEGECQLLIFTTENLSQSAPPQNSMDSIVESMNRTARSSLAGAFLSIIPMYTDAETDASPSFNFAPTLAEINQKYSKVQAKLKQLEANMSENYTETISQLKSALSTVNEARLAQTESCYSLVETFRQLRTRTERVLRVSEELKSQSTALKARIVKPPAVIILSIIQDSRKYLIVNVQLMKHRAARYQIAYFPPAVSLDIVAMRPSQDRAAVPLASSNSFPPGEYEVFFHKEGNIAQVKSNRFRFFIELQEGQTPMG